MTLSSETILPLGRRRLGRGRFALVGAAEGFDEGSEILHGAIDGDHTRALAVADQVDAFGAFGGIRACFAVVVDPVPGMHGRTDQILPGMAQPEDDIVPTADTELDLVGGRLGRLGIDLPLKRPGSGRHRSGPRYPAAPR